MAQPQTILSTMQFDHAVELFEHAVLPSVQGVVASFEALEAVEMSLPLVTQEDAAEEIVLRLPEVGDLRIAG